MSNEIKIVINGEEMSIKEAKQLYEKLSELFYNEYLYYPPININKTSNPIGTFYPNGTSTW